eukprot:774217-Pelagomonas_calceolata.AAC.3
MVRNSERMPARGGVKDEEDTHNGTHFQDQEQCADAGAWRSNWHTASGQPPPLDSSEFGAKSQLKPHFCQCHPVTRLTLAHPARQPTHSVRHTL